jgi:hypothetical protein
MNFTIAYAEQVDMSEGNWRIVLIWTAVLMGACLLAIVPILIAKARRHRQAETILALAIVWGMLAAGSVGYAVNARINWEKEYTLRVKTGYFDPRDVADAPVWPRLKWGFLAGGLVVLLIFSSTGHSRKM